MAEKLSLGIQNIISPPFLGCRGVRDKRAKGAVGGTGGEKTCSALLQNTKQKNSFVVVQCVANYDHEKKVSFVL